MEVKMERRNGKNSPASVNSSSQKPCRNSEFGNDCKFCWWL